LLLNCLGAVAFTALVGALLFGTAGRWDLPMFWAYLAVLCAVSVAGGILTDPGLVKERARPGPGGKFYATDLPIPLLWLALYAVAGLDVSRLHWSDNVPLAAQAVALAVTAIAFAFGVWATAVNRFFATAVRIQTDRGHHVITSGPYRFVRHPGYAAFPFIFVGSGMALGSWSAALVGVVMFLLLLPRVIDEDRTLRAELAGYSEYAQKVRYRLLPGVW
jgi:protein-S-isoprenylcysteine O-methyltransferase Ste14